MEELMAKYLADELSNTERADFESQLIQDERFSLEFEAYLNAWALQDERASDTFDTPAAWNSVQKKITETPVVPMRRTNFSFLKIAATLLVLAVSGYFVVNSGKTLTEGTQSFAEHVSPEKGMKEIQLPDGTKVKLNANSKISYDESFGESNRNVTLIGEADFDVTRNEQLPFVIIAGSTKTEVLGTSFNLAAYPGRSVKVAVTEGTVAFSSTSNEDRKAVLNKGQKAVIDVEGKSIAVTQIKDNNFKGWWTKELTFDRTPFEDAFETLETTYHVEFVYPEALKDCLWTYQIRPNQTIEDVMAVFDSSYAKVKVTLNKNQIILEGTACDK